MKIPKNVSVKSPEYKNNQINFLGVMQPINRKKFGIRLFEMNKNLDVLYIKPCFDRTDYNIPMGLIGLMNLIDVNKCGIYSFSLTDEIILNTKIIAMDLHWYWNMKPIYNLSKQIKKINPDIKIIIGGYTATIFADIIIKKWPVDFVIVGDAEKPFKLLVDKLLSNDKNLFSIPNLVMKNHRNKWDYIINSEIFNSIDFVNIDWFPEYKDILENEILMDEDTISTYSSFLPIARGCHNSCENCYGSKKNYYEFSRNTQIVRNADVIKNDLIRLSNNPGRKEVSIISDFIDMYHKNIVNSDFIDKILKDVKYNLDLIYEFYNIPSIDEIKLFQNSFNYFWFTISINKCHGQSNKFCEMEHILKIIKYVNATNNLHLAILGSFDDKEVVEIIKQLPKKNNKLCYLNDSSWHLDTPWIYKEQAKMLKQYKKFYSMGIQYSKLNYFEKSLNNPEK